MRRTAKEHESPNFSECFSRRSVTRLNSKERSGSAKFGFVPAFKDRTVKASC
jgi:hypothetical protein